MEKYGTYTNDKVLLDHNDTQLLGVAKVRKREQDGTIHGKANDNLMLYTRVNDASFPNGTNK